MRKIKLLISYTLVAVCLSGVQVVSAQCPVAASCTPGTATNAGLGFAGGIYKVSIGTILKNSSGDTDGYQDYSCTDSTSLNVGQNYSVLVHTGTSINETVKIWIDLDNNGVLDNSTELVYTSNTGLQVHSGTLIVPNGTTMNTPLRMRVSSDWDASTTPIPCSTPSYGQVEDYMVRVLPNPNPPIADFSVNETISCSGTASFTDISTNIPTEWKWYFGDGDSSFLQNPTHTYALGGSYTITLISSNFNGSDTIIKTNYFTYNSNSPVAATCFPTTSSYCCNYGIYKVDLGNISHSSGNASEGNMDFSCVASTALTEGTPYPITLQTNGTLAQDFNIYLDQNNDGILNETNEKIATILGAINPTETIKIPSGSLLNTPLRLRICADHEGSAITSCGTLTNGQCEDYTVTVLENTSPPIANFTVDNDTKCDSLFVFTNTSQNNMDDVLWDFGDGSTSTDIDPVHSYPEEGVYTVKLTISNQYGIDSIVRESYITRNKPATAICTVASFAPEWMDVGIKNVVINTAGLFNNTAGDDDKSYKDYSCDKVAEFNSGQSYATTVYTGSEDVEQVRIYIDWNNDGIIQEFSELVFDETQYVSHTGNITVPETNVVKNVRLRMRVMSIMAQGGGFISSACDDIQRGEVEDYSVIVDRMKGVEDILPMDVMVYPNPNSGSFNIKSENLSIDKISIFNMLGEQVYVRQVQRDQREFALNLNLPEGLYLVQLESGTSRTTQKLVIKH